MKLSKGWMTTFLLIGLLAGGLLVGAILSGVPGRAAAAPATQVEEPDAADEADEAAPANTGITADEARAIVGAAYPDATILEVEFDRAGDVTLFEAELDNGMDVRVDATTGDILDTETRDAD